MPSAKKYLDNASKRLEELARAMTPVGKITIALHADLEEFTRAMIEAEAARAAKEEEAKLDWRSNWRLRYGTDAITVDNLEIVPGSPEAAREQERLARLQRQGYEVVDLEAYIEEMGDVMPIPPREIAARELAGSEDIMDNEVRRLLGHGQTGVWEEFYSCPSYSDPSKSYVVSRSKYDTWGCSCPRWIFKREDCKHIKRVTAALGNPGYAIHTQNVVTLSEKTRRALGRIARVEIEATAGPESLEDKDKSGRAARLEL